jgi:transmembrane sensor
MSTRTAPARPQTPAIEAAAADWVTRCDAGLTPAEQQIFQDWLAADARHADAFDRLSEAWAVFDRVQEGGAISEVLAGLARRARQRRTRRVQVAAAAALVVFAALLWVRLAEPTLAPVREDRSRLAANDRIRRLPDGSVVELKPGAEIAVHYEQADARRVTLVRGEAFFRVAKDATRPFFVESQGITVRAVGTAFSVQAQATAVEVVVKEGAVDVGRNTAAASDANPLRLAAGQKVIFPMALLRPAMRVPATADTAAPAAAVGPTSEPTVETLSETDLEQRLSWRDTREVFNNTSLHDAVARLNRQNITQILIKDPAVGRLCVDGYFRSDNPEGFVRIVEESFGLQAEELDGHTLLLRARP